MKNLLASLVAVSAVAGSLTGCAGRPLFQPPPVEAIVLLEAPLPASIAVYIPPDIADKSTHFSYRYHTLWFPEGKLIERTALRAFSQYFATVALRQQMPQADRAVKIRGYSVLNPLIGSYYVDVIAECFTSEGELLEAFKASHVENAAYFAYTPIFEYTYLKAFQKLGSQLAGSEKCAGTLRSSAAQSN